MGGEALGEILDGICVAGEGGEVVEFVGIGFEVEELPATGFGVPDEFVVAGADHALDIAVGGEDGIGAGVAAFDEVDEGGAFEAGWGFEAGFGADGGEELVVVAEAVGAAAGEAVSGEAKDEGDLDAVVVHGHFAEKSVGAEGEAVIGDEGDEGVFEDAGLFEGGEDAADLLVEVGDEGVVGGDLGADGGFGAGPGEELFVADLEFTVIEGVFGDFCTLEPL